MEAVSGIDKRFCPDERRPFSLFSKRTAPLKSIRRFKMILRLGVYSILCAATAFSHEAHAGKPVTIVGTVVDTGCYVTHDSTGPKHVDCATACAKNGIPLAIVDAQGKLHLPIAADHKNP